MIPSLVEFTPNNWDKYLKKNVDGIDILEKIKDKLDLYNSKTEDIPMYPDINNIFKAFTYFDPSETRVIIFDVNLMGNFVGILLENDWNLMGK